MIVKCAVATSFSLQAQPKNGECFYVEFPPSSVNLTNLVSSVCKKLLLLNESGAAGGVGDENVKLFFIEVSQCSPRPLD